MFYYDMAKKKKIRSVIMICKNLLSVIFVGDF